MASDSFLSGHHTTIHGGTGGPGGIGGGIGGDGGNGEGPQFNVSGAENWNVTVYGDLRVNPEAKSQSLHAMRQKDHKLCPLPVSSFTGRKDILQEMHQHFDSDQGSQHIFVLHGLGGSGKSQLAFKFLQDSQAHHRFSEIFYIDATNEQTIETDLKIVAPAVVGGSAEASLHWLAGKQEEWLILFDNADDVQLEISKFFPHCTFGNILITTRNHELCIHASAGSRVSDMEPDDAKDLLLQLAYQGKSDKQEKLSSDVQEKLAAAIVKELHCFALAISQAGGYIHARGKLSGYLKLYQSHRDQLLQHVEVQRQNQYGLAVYATWNLSYKKLSSPGRTMLQICSRLHHEGIFEQMFEKASRSQEDLDDSELQSEVTQLLTALGKRDGNWDSFVFHGVMGELESYSLIEQDRQDDSYRIHPLVQHWSGTTMETNSLLMQKCVLAMIGLSISLSYEDKDHKYRHKLLQHVTRSIDSLNREEICTFVATRIGRVYFEGGRWKDAEALAVVVMEMNKHVLGDEHPVTLASMAHLASTYQKQGRWKDAEALKVVVMEMSKHILGEEHPDTLRSMTDLASTYQSQGRWEDAEALEVVVMEMEMCMLGEEHPSTLTTMANLACTYRNQGYFKDAEALEVVVMEMRKRVLGEEHPSTLRSMANLASTYQFQGRFKDAEALFVVAMEMRKRVLGEEHPDTLTCMANLAVTYQCQGRWQDAEALEVVVMELRKCVQGEEHPDTLLSMANLVSTYQNQGRWQDAEVLEVVMMELRNRVLEVHPDTLAHLVSRPGASTPSSERAAVSPAPSEMSSAPPSVVDGIETPVVQLAKGRQANRAQSKKRRVTADAAAGPSQPKKAKVARVAVETQDCEFILPILQPKKNLSTDPNSIPTQSDV
ncbi:P-loop containing nucleoside triphosphate hydrolase protein [Mycena rebaudengoi]|nr:P-loop containing nucleoside triphosphate hydrolase protein [Mycena rebaudengoi]